ncbi:ribose-phosphate pyrophosphokinase [Treponema sp. R8-4-B8]
MESINILSADPLENKSLWIVDDMIDTAGSVEKLIRALSQLKPKDINIIAVHALFSPPAVQKIDALIKDGLLNRMIVTDTVCCSGYKEKLQNLEVVQSAELASGILKAIINNESLGNLLKPFSAREYFGTK